MKPAWDLLETDLYAREIRRELRDGNLWISTLDLEIAWMAKAVPNESRLLTPSAAGLQPTLKPRPRIAEMLPFPLPDSLDLRSSESEIYDFCRRHSFRVWLKGPYHDAIAVTSWPHFEAMRESMRKVWKTDQLSLQAHVRGYEESICLAALDGKILDVIFMQKRLVTPDGKTWAGRVSNVPAIWLDPLRATVKALRWTGGAELELLRDLDGKHWLMEWNPRFPAWIYGAALAGRNLPAALVGAVLGRTPDVKVSAPTGEFTRVVLEIPVKEELPLPILAEPYHGQLGPFGKYGAALPSVIPLLEGAGNERKNGKDGSSSSLEETPENLGLDLRDGLRAEEVTPHRFLLKRTAGEAFAVAAKLGKLSANGVELRPAYSLKTSPDLAYLKLARSGGMMGECISMLEVDRALEAGWRTDEIVLNGPGKWWPGDMRKHQGLRAVFCDSIEELDRLVESGRKDHFWGVRLRIPGFHSRFGIMIEEPDDLNRIVKAIGRFPKGRGFGVHVHLSSTFIGEGHWLDAVESAMVWGKTLAEGSGRSLEILDLGGGFHPNDLARLPFDRVLDSACAILPSLKELLIEPGRALTQATMAVVTKVLDVRRRDGEIDEVVVDACIAELPLARVYPHRWWYVTNDNDVRPIAKGSAKILGRICMEDDVLNAGAALPPKLKPGDRLVVGDAGAYERTMCYDFGRGGY